MKQFSQDHVFLGFTIVAGMCVLILVPQVTNLYQQMPPWDVSLWLLVQFLLFVLGLAIFYIPSMFLLAQVSPQPQDNTRSSRARFIFHVAQTPGRLAGGWLNWLFRLDPGLARWLADRYPSIYAQLPSQLWVWGATGLTTLGLGVAALVFGGGVQNSRLYPLAGMACQLFGFVLAAIGIWLMWAVVKSTLPAGRPGPVWSMFGCVLGWFVVASLIGEVLWVFSYMEWLNVSYRLFSLWSIVHVFTVLVIIGSFVDYLHRWTLWPFRQLALMAIIGVIWLHGPWRINDGSLAKNNPSESGAEQATSIPDWYNYIDRRLDELPPGPAVIVTASGGGSRAAIFTALALEMLAQTPMDFETNTGNSVEGSGGNTESKRGQKPTWANQIVLISSVSGGSLSAAHYVHRACCPSELRIDGLRHTSRNELLHRIRNHLKRIKREGDKEKIDLDHVKQMLHFVNHYDSDDNRLRWVLESEFVDDMCADFMAPILRSAFLPTCSTGDSLSSFWEQGYGWSSVTRTNGKMGGTENEYLDPAVHPLLLLNVADIDAGERLAIGFPPLPKGLFDDESPRRKNAHPRAFSDLDPNDTCDLSLARAVQLSANFPWGFRVAQLDHRSNPSLKLPRDDEGDKATNDQEVGALHLLDGGIVDNTGIDTVHHLFRKLQHRAANRNDGRAECAARILRKFRERGVIIVEIDSGAKPVREAARGPFRWLSEPIRALNNSLYNNADLTKAHYKEDLEKTFSLDEDLPRVSWLTIACNALGDEAAEVMTAWALGPNDKGILLGQFLTHYRTWEQELNKAGKRLESIESHKQKLAIAKKMRDSWFEPHMAPVLADSSPLEQEVKELEQQLEDAVIQFHEFQRDVEERAMQRREFYQQIGR